MATSARRNDSLEVRKSNMRLARDMGDTTDLISDKLIVFRSCGRLWGSNWTVVGRRGAL